MRHVILGSNTPIGSSIIRLLASINADDIIAVSPSASLPDGIDPKRVTTKFGDVIDIYTLKDLFEKGDIIYNCQIISDELANVEEAELYNNIGFINLLGVASLTEVDRIICAIPLTLGYDLPEVATVNDFGKSPSPIQKTLRETCVIAEKYTNGESFGWKHGNIAKFAEERDTDPDTVGTSDELDETKSGPSIKHGPKLSSNSKEDNSSSHGPNMKNLKKPMGGPKLSNDGTKSKPSLGGPNLKNVNKNGTSSNDEEEENSDVEPKSETKIDDDKSGINDPSSENDSVEPLDIELDRVPLVIGRFAKLFGPFESKITPEYCKSIRLQRIEIVGETDSKISWINPIDAGRAMILMGDPNINLQSGHYPITGFDATPLEILDVLDEINHSELDITHKSLQIKRITHWFKTIISLVGISVNDDYYDQLSRNRRQIFDDSKSKEQFNWDPKYGLRKTAKEALNWFISHHI